MAIHLLRETTDYRLGIWKIEEDEARLLELSRLTVAPQHLHSMRRQEHLAVRAMAAKMAVPPTNIAYMPSGKPYLVGTDLSISISHTKGFVGVLLSNHQHIGLDLEHQSERVKKIRHKFMHPDEEAQLKIICNPINETVGLLLHWCAKESLFKSVPEEGVDFAQELRISNLGTLNESGRFKGCFMRTGEQFEIDYVVEPDFVLTCSFSTESK